MGILGGSCKKFKKEREARRKRKLHEKIEEEMHREADKLRRKADQERRKHRSEKGNDGNGADARRASTEDGAGLYDSGLYKRRISSLVARRSSVELRIHAAE